MKKYSCIIILIYLWATGAFAQGLPYIFIGEFVDEGTRQPVTHLRIELKAQKGGEIIYSETDLQGKFKIELPPNKVYILRGYHPRYLTSEAIEISTSDFSPGIIERKIYVREVVKGGIIRFDNIEFAPNAYTLEEKELNLLTPLVQFLKDNPSIVVEVGCHTDSRGRDLYNLEISEKRASFIAEQLIKKGISQSRLQPKGYGEMRIINQCENDIICSTEEHRQNRRIELTILDIR